MIFPEVIIHQPDSFEDFRGELYTLYKENDYNLNFNHDKVSISRKNTLRGLHGDNKSWKLVTCLAGEIYLVIVDNSHFILSKEATFFYKWSYPGKYPDVDDQFTLKWNDPKLNITWPNFNPILSSRDK